MKTNKKCRNRIGVTFKYPQAANQFVQNENLKIKGYNIFITEDKNNNQCIKMRGARRLNRKTVEYGTIEYPQAQSA